MKLAKNNFAVRIDYWVIDWNCYGCTFKTQWQSFRGNGRKAKTVPIVAIETLDKKKLSETKSASGGKQTIAVRVMDMFGNDVGAILEV